MKPPRAPSNPLLTLLESPLAIWSRKFSTVLAIVSNKLDIFSIIPLPVNLLEILSNAFGIRTIMSIKAAITLPSEAIIGVSFCNLSGKVFTKSNIFPPTVVILVPPFLITSSSEEKKSPTIARRLTNNPDTNPTIVDKISRILEITGRIYLPRIPATLTRVFPIILRTEERPLIIL